ncbi:hypothetical protein BO71DRAFT_434936 [Aspergillus ellipticus CBS 707.79]|uniref:F-box domain-containing protein n=1 Tax=Aspergillus ellipticus CBS 707.79 TaxID=1448320 RepID=A0A319CX93_9EURO|nr:hypothetical protein BO71DRAFT_434936 [Aspergillus ellipticus CBS 707.79]
MPALTDLPTELLLLIIESFSRSRDVRSLSQVNQGLRAIVHDHDLVNKTKYRGIYITFGEGILHTTNRVLTILRFPQLCNYARHIEIGYTACCSRTDQQRSGLNQADMERLREIAAKSGFTPANQQKLINMAFYVSGDSFTLQALLRQANTANITRNSPYLGRLKYFCIIAGNIWYDPAPAITHLLLMNLVHTLPSIQSFHMEAADKNGSVPRQLLEPASSNISSITVIEPKFRVDVLCEMIAATKCLREVRYTVDPAGERIIYQEDEIQRLMNALLHHRATLETLDLSFRCNCCILRVHCLMECLSWDHTPGYILPSGSLEDFTALRSLSLEANCLWYFANDPKPVTCLVSLFDHLPSQLEYLCIKALDPAHNKIAGVEAARERLSKLKTVKGLNGWIPSRDRSYG